MFKTIDRFKFKETFLRIQQSIHEICRCETFGFISFCV